MFLCFYDKRDVMEKFITTKMCCKNLSFPILNEDFAWPMIYGPNYLYLTAHYIDADWKLCR